MALRHGSFSFFFPLISPYHFSTYNQKKKTKPKKASKKKKTFMIMKKAFPIWRNEGLFEEALKTEFQ